MTLYFSEADKIVNFSYCFVWILAAIVMSKHINFIYFSVILPNCFIAFTIASDFE